MQIVYFRQQEIVYFRQQEWVNETSPRFVAIAFSFSKLITYASKALPERGPPLHNPDPVNLNLEHLGCLQASPLKGRMLQPESEKTVRMSEDERRPARDAR
jgi:hypothetical protein